MGGFERIGDTIDRMTAEGLLPATGQDAVNSCAGRQIGLETDGRDGRGAEKAAKGLQTIFPILLVDSREQRPLPLTRFPIERVGLSVGDYGIKGFSDWENPAFILERKSLPDLCASLGRERERFLREVEKMRGFRFRGLVIEAAVDEVECSQYRSLISPSAVLGTLDALSVRAGVHVFWCRDAFGAARRVESLAEKFCRGIAKDAARLSGTPQRANMLH